ncbi:uncharacterized protein [Diadema setosum]|uniref:uncharacterized protein n=1 Tax=Diadema setosum TaxID=31175 RepID=UPI003B3B9DA1
MGDIYEVQEILRSRQKRNGQTEYRIRWKGFGPEEDTWEPEENLVSCADILEDFKKRQSHQQLDSKTVEGSHSDQLTSQDSNSEASTTRNSTMLTRSQVSIETPGLLRRSLRVRQRSTPKVQRVLGLKHMPTVSNRDTVDVDDINDKAEKRMDSVDDALLSQCRPVQCNKWAAIAGLVCILVGVVLLVSKNFID